jgi:4-hydroxy-tetrahydrodipicolinate reductase
MNNIAIFGANGRMGKVLVEAIQQHCDNQLVAAAVRPDSSLVGVDVGELAGVGKNGITLTSDLTASIEIIDVLIDFTLPGA